MSEKIKVRFCGLTYEEIEQLKQRELEMTAQVGVYQEMSAQLYQAAGAYDMPVEVLDNLSDMANGDMPRHKEILPIYPPQQSLAEHDAEVVERLLPAKKHVPEDTQHPKYALGWNDMIREMRIRANQLRQKGNRDESTNEHAD